MINLNNGDIQYIDITMKNGYGLSITICEGNTYSFSVLDDGKISSNTITGISCEKVNELLADLGKVKRDD